MAGKRGARHPDWDAPIAALGMSAREYIRRVSHIKTDGGIASDLRRVGFPANNDMVKGRRISLGAYKSGVLAASPLPRYDSPPEHEGDCVVIGDVEFPFHEHEFVNRVLDLCQAWKITHVWFNGDMIHNHELSGFEPNWEAAPGEMAGIGQDIADGLLAIASQLGKKGDALREFVGERTQQTGLASASHEWALARECVRSMRQVFKSATWVLGNHEGRFIRTLQSPVTPDDFRNLVLGDGSDWIKTAPYYHGTIRSGGVEWRATHPKNTSIKPADIAAKLAEKHHVNVIQSHNHLWGMRQSDSGRYIGVEIGCCVDGYRLAYKSQRDNTRPEWQLGACIIRDGFCWLLHPAWTDWKRLVRMGK